MSRPAWLRVLIAVWGCWFTTTVVEPAGLFACEMHGAAASHAPAATVARTTTADAAADARAMPASHAHHASTPSADVTASGRDVPAPAHHGCCTCLGHCCQSAPVATPAPALTLTRAVERDAAIAAITVVSHAATRRPYDLPYSNGPPASAL